MTNEQRKIVEDNMGLVGKVIKDKVHGIGHSGVYSYDDLFQIGCIGLCKAAMTDKGGCFSTYAYRLIWNEICDELIRSTRLTQRQLSVNAPEVMEISTMTDYDPFENCHLCHILEQAKSKARGTTAKGIRYLELTLAGYNSQEIGSMVEADAATVRVWITRAKKYLRNLPELRCFVYPEAV